MKSILRFSICIMLFFTLPVHAQNLLAVNRGHSHNDYHQTIPLLTAYQAGMGSIEADVFFKKGQLYVAHDTTEIREGATLKKLYLAPLHELYVKNGNRPYADPSLTLQLVIDIKENYLQVLPLLIAELETFNNTFNSRRNPNAIRIVISGNVPVPAAFKDYPDYIAFDGRPYIKYSRKQLKRIAMISDDIKKYTKWKGLGNPPAADELKLKAVIEKAHQQHKPFRFWATADLPDSWLYVEKLGADWINTDHPDQLRAFFQENAPK
jgi:alkaline phosphatase